MHEELKKSTYRNIITTILLTIVWTNLVGIYGILIFIFLSVGFYYEYKKESKRIDAGLPKIDERSMMIAGKASMVLFRVMLFWFIGLLFYHILTDIPNPIAPKLDVPIVIIASIFVMMATAFSASYYYDKQGDF